MGRGALAALALASAVGLAASVFAQVPRGATLTGKVTVLRDGKPEADASGVVVWVGGFEEPAPSKPAELIQEGRAFEPSILPVTAGQKVLFPNLDGNTSHNVFSFEPNFNLGQYRQGRGTPPGHVFRHPGVVDVYCNIHPEMAATILVLQNRKYAVTKADGSFEIAGIPPGEWTVFAYDRHAVAPVNAKVNFAGDGTVSHDFTVAQTRFDFSHKNYYGGDYPKEYAPAKH